MANKSKEDFKKELSAESYHVTQENGTERPFTGQYWDHVEDGIYACICCGEKLFKSEESVLLLSVISALKSNPSK